MGGDTAPELVAVLEHAQRLGFLGDRPIPEVIEHARGFVRALAPDRSIRTVLDLGSGAGVPGLIIAHDLPTVQVILLDRRAKRTDLLERAVRRLGWRDRVSVVCRDVTEYGPDHSFDAVVARGFGPPTFTLTSGARLARIGGTIVISEPPGANRWDPDLLDRLRLERTWPTGDGDGAWSAPALQSDQSPDGLVATFRRSGSAPTKR